MHTTLAHNMRPVSLDDVIGQTHLVGEGAILRQMIKKKHPMSMILYGPPGCGKTTIAKAFAHDLDVPYRLFNASTGNKKEMDQIIAEAKLSDGLLTANPYHSINPAIRSRCSIFKVEPLTNDDIIAGLKRAALSPNGLNNAYQFDEEAYQYIAKICAGDIRYAYNCLELATISVDGNHIKASDLAKVIPHANLQYDKDEDQYYDTLSGLQKSIRGSDVNGALYYLAKLIEVGDLESLERRLLVIAYEEIGLANPNAAMRTVMAFQAAKIVGFPEARIPLAQVVIDLCLSPKSKSSEYAIDAAMASLKAHPYNAPKYLRLSPVGLKDEEKYDYDCPEMWEYLQYLPDEIKDVLFYQPAHTSKYEQALANNYERLLRHGRSNSIPTIKEALKKHQH